MGSDARFIFASEEIEIEPCTPNSDLAHELGHWIMYLANNRDVAATFADSLENFCPGGSDGEWCIERWVKGHEYAPGVEHAAHCVGWVLSGTGAFTKCPDPGMQQEARSRVTSV